MSLDMLGHIDSTFESIPASQVSFTGGDYDLDGIWQEGTESLRSYSVNIQPLNDREIQSLQIGAERVRDYRVIHVNDGDFHSLSPEAQWQFDANNVGDQRYKVIDSDIRVWRSYARLVVCLIDS